MIFTLGRKESYDANLATYEADPSSPKPEKRGRDPEEDYDYPGGSVWETEAEARADCPPGFAVYGVKAVWGKDTEQSKDGDWHDLLKTSEFVTLTRKMTVNDLIKRLETTASVAFPFSTIINAADARALLPELRNGLARSNALKRVP